MRNCQVAFVQENKECDDKEPVQETNVSQNSSVKTEAQSELAPGCFGRLFNF